MVKVDYLLVCWFYCGLMTCSVAKRHAFSLLRYDVIN